MKASEAKILTKTGSLPELISISEVYDGIKSAAKEGKSCVCFPSGSILENTKQLLIQDGYRVYNIPGLVKVRWD